MIIALLALALAMILGGMLAAFFGWDIVLIERGWSMVIAGTTGAACGALLLGLTAIVAKLSRIQSELARLRIGVDEAGRREVSSPTIDVSAAALAGGLLGGRMSAPDEEKEREEAQPDLPLFEREDRHEPAGPHEEREPSAEAGEGMRLPPFGPRTYSDETPRRDEDEETDLKVPDFLLAERPGEPRAESRGAPLDTVPFADEPKLDLPEEERRDEPLGADLREPVTEAVPEPTPEPTPEPEAKAEPEAEAVAATEEFSEAEDAGRDETPGDAPDETPRSPAAIIGTYNSGDNTYVMFSDGSIEAQTPGGVFRFQSLDELKAFIASGGEGGSTGGASAI